MTKNVEFIEKFIEILGGDDFFLCDLVDQDDLFEKQRGLSKLICDSANDGLGLARHIVGLLPCTFNIEVD